MNYGDFEKWLAHHAECYDGLTAWMEKLANEDRRDGVLRRWYGVMRSLDLTDAKDASEELWKQNEQPRGFDRHPVLVAEIARRNRRTRDAYRPVIVDGEEAVRCLLCNDTGAVRVFTVEAMRLVREGKLGTEYTVGDGLKARVAPTTCVAACTCRAGDDWANHMRRYDDRVMVRVEDKTDVLIERVF